MIRYLLILNTFFLTFILFGQDSTLNRLPVAQHNLLFSNCTDVQVTLLNSGKGLTFSGRNAQYYVNTIDTLPPSNIIKKKDAYMMFLNSGKEILEGYLSFGEADEMYMVFKIDTVSYYNKLRPEGVEIFKPYK